MEWNGMELEWDASFLPYPAMIQDEANTGEEFPKIGPIGFG